MAKPITPESISKFVGWAVVVFLVLWLLSSCRESSTRVYRNTDRGPRAIIDDSTSLRLQKHSWKEAPRGNFYEKLVTSRPSVPLLMRLDKDDSRVYELLPDRPLRLSEDDGAEVVEFAVHPDADSSESTLQVKLLPK